MPDWILNISGAPAVRLQPSEADGLAVRHRVGQESERLFLALRDRIYGFLAAMGARPADAEEVTQEAFIRFHQQLQGGVEIGNPRAWLFQTARNLYLTEVTSKRVRSTIAAADVQSTLNGLAGRQTDPEAAAIEQQRRMRLEVAMRALTPLQFEYLHLRAEGLRFREIAEIYHVAVGSVQDVVRRAIEQLGKELV